MKYTCPRCKYVINDWSYFELHMSEHNKEDAKRLETTQSAELARYQAVAQAAREVTEEYKNFSTMIALEEAIAKLAAALATLEQK